MHQNISHRQNVTFFSIYLNRHSTTRPLLDRITQTKNTSGAKTTSSSFRFVETFLCMSRGSHKQSVADVHCPFPSSSPAFHSRMDVNHKLKPLFVVYMFIYIFCLFLFTLFKWALASIPASEISRDECYFVLAESSQSSLSHEPSKIFVICWFGAQETSLFRFDYWIWSSKELHLFEI